MVKPSLVIPQFLDLDSQRCLLQTQRFLEHYHRPDTELSAVLKRAHAPCICGSAPVYHFICLLSLPLFPRKLGLKGSGTWRRRGHRPIEQPYFPLFWSLSILRPHKPPPSEPSGRGEGKGSAHKKQRVCCLHSSRLVPKGQAFAVGLSNAQTVGQCVSHNNCLGKSSSVFKKKRPDFRRWHVIGRDRIGCGIIYSWV